MCVTCKKGWSGKQVKTFDRPSVRDIIRAPVGGIRGSGTYIPENSVSKNTFQLHFDSSALTN